jgi:acetolactate synthase-1/2/3 large subunit
MLQAPVATSVSGKGVIPDTHPLAVGCVARTPRSRPRRSSKQAVTPIITASIALAIGVRYSEVSTGFYSQPQTKHLIHVDANADNLGRVMKTDVSVHSDAGFSLPSCSNTLTA